MSGPYSAGYTGYGQQQPYGQVPQQPYSQPGYGQQQGYVQPTLFTPQLPPTQPGSGMPGNAPGAAGGLDPLMSGFAANVLRQSGENYLQRGQAFMQSKLGFLTTSTLHYHFNVSTEYVRQKLLMLLAPFLKRWTYTRVAEQIAGGHKYLPPRQDTNAPDLYIPFTAMCTYVILLSIGYTRAGKFSPDTMYPTVSSAVLAWTVHWVVLKALLYMMGIPGAVPFLEVVAYAGYAFVPVCLSMLVGMLAGRVAYHALWFYGSLCMAVFMVRTMKRIIFHEARQYSSDATHNYLLLGLAVFQFPFALWLGGTSW